nr:hypothetical protein CFP56_63561 [Quercus suber]
MLFHTLRITAYMPLQSFYHDYLVHSMITRLLRRAAHASSLSGLFNLGTLCMNLSRTQKFFNHHHIGPNDFPFLHTKTHNGKFPQASEKARSGFDLDEILSVDFDTSQHSAEHNLVISSLDGSWCTHSIAFVVAQVPAFRQILPRAVRYGMDFDLARSARGTPHMIFAILGRLRIPVLTYRCDKMPCAMALPSGKGAKGHLFSNASSSLLDTHLWRRGDSAMHNQ